MTDDLMEILARTRTPIQRAELLDLLDDAEVVEGYESGHAGDPEPGNNRSYSFWHGWRNGAVDGGHRKGDSAQAALAKDMVEGGWLRNLGRGRL